MRHLFALTALGLAACESSGEEAEYLNAAAIELSATNLEFGTFQGTTTEQAFTLLNTGDVSLGIASVGLASSTNDTHGDHGAFGIYANAGEVLDRNGDPAGLPDDSSLLAEIPAGGSWTITAAYEPDESGEHYDAVVVTTASGAGASASNLESVWADPDNETVRVTMHGSLDTEPVSVAYVPPRVELGRVYEEETTSVVIRNYGPAAFTVTSIAAADGGCASGFTITPPELPAEVTQSQVAKIDIAYDPWDLDPANCTIDVSGCTVKDCKGSEWDDLDPNPFTARLLAQRGETLERLGRDDDALLVYEQALDMNRDLLEEVMVGGGR